MSFFDVARSKLWRTGVASLALLVCAASADADIAGVRGRIVDASNLALPGVVVTLTPAAGQSKRAATTDLDGHYEIGAPPGAYVLSTSLSGFDPISRTVVVGDQWLVDDLQLQISHVQADVSVSAPAPSVMSSAQPNDPAVVDRDVIDHAILHRNNVLDTLPLLPNVLRGPDGLISVAGARAPQGQLLVHGLTQNDPVLGAPTLLVPLDPVQSVDVLAHGYPTEYGRSTGGITQIELRAPTDQFRFTVNSLDPRPHFSNGGIRGIEAWEPNAGISGPLVRGRVWYLVGADYHWERFTFDTNAGEQESRYASTLTWSEIHANVTPNHRLFGWVSTDPQTTQHADITAFTAPSSLPAVHSGGWRGAVSDRLRPGPDATLETSVQVAALHTDITPSGDLPYVMGHDLVQGNYFNAQHRDATRVEVSEQYTRTISGWLGAHLVKAGGLASAIGFDGVNSGTLVEQLRSDGSMARTMTFAGPGAQSAHGREGALFVQDTWAPRGDLTVDAGVRYDAASLAHGSVVAPRVAIAWTADERTTLGGGVGRYSDKVLLATAAFPSLPSRVVTEYAAGGAPIAGPHVYVNQLGDPLRMPSADAWYLRLDRRIGAGLLARVVYQEQHGHQEPTIALDDAAGALELMSDGISRTRSVETTVGYHPSADSHSIYVSYVRSSAIGSLNDFNSVEGMAKDPYVRPDAIGPLAADAPHRVLAWGLIKLPLRITVSPFFEIRSGFPYSAIDDEWNVVGARNGQRFPVFSSLDIVVNKVVTLPAPLRSARIGLKVFNVIGTNDARDIQRDLARGDYGALYNPLLRQVRGIFEIQWGRH